MPELTYTYASLMPVYTLPPVPASLSADFHVDHKMNMVYTSFGRRFNLVGETWEPSPQHRMFMARFYRIVENLLLNGKLRLMAFEVVEGGLVTIPQGIADMRDGKVRGRKLVYLTTDSLGVGGGPSTTA